MAEQGDDGGLADGTELRLDGAPHGGCAGLADHGDDLGRGVGAEGVERGERHEAPDGRAHVATTHPDGLGDALALRREEHRHLLQARARGRHDPDAPARDEIGKAELGMPPR